MTTELDSFAEAAEAALAELGEATPSDDESSTPEDESNATAEPSQAEVEESEQTESQPEVDEQNEDSEGAEEATEEESMFADLELDDDEVEPESTAIPEDAEFELPGIDEPVSLQELKDGFLRQSDYTRKTQEVAELRKQNEKASRLWDALQKEPLAVAKQLAVEAGLLEKDATPVRAVDFSPITSAEELEAEIEKRVEAAVEEHPSVQEARRQDALMTINNEFDRIEGELDTKLNQATRQDILREAKRRGVADLELVTQNMLARKQRIEAERQNLRDAAPNKATGNTQTETAKGPADSFDEAAERALIELGMAD